MNSSLFDLTGRVAIITGGLGLLGLSYARAIHSAGGIPIALDVRAATETSSFDKLGFELESHACSITDEQQVQAVASSIISRHGRVDILINNAANNPKVEVPGSLSRSRLEHFDLDQWNGDIAVGLTGALICSRVFGSEMARRGAGVIVNIASDLALIAPDQRLYAVETLEQHEQPVKPVSYSVVKSGLIGLTRYLATYWASSGVRANALCPGGVENGQDTIFLSRIAERIPMARMAGQDEYQGAILFLCSDASSYMTGSVLAVDGGRTCW